MKRSSLFTAIVTSVVLYSASSPARAAMVYFEELADKGGIVIHAENQLGATFTSDIIAGEVARAGNRDGCNRFGCDLNIPSAGLGADQLEGTGYALLEADGKTVSDMLVQVGVRGFIVWEFIADPLLLPDNINILNAIVKNGEQQLLGQYINDQGATVSLYAKAALEVPISGTLPLLVTGLGILGVMRRRRNRISPPPA